MSAYSDAQIAQLIAGHAALKDEVAALKGLLRHAKGLVRDLHTGGNPAYCHPVKQCECCAFLFDRTVLVDHA